MQAKYESPLTEDLLKHANSIRRLAIQLVGDSAEAEDLVQETWVAAIVHRPEADRSLLPWLGTVLRNFARRSSRRVANRPVVEREAEEPLTASDPADVCQGIEAARVLSTELAELDEPYRSTIFLRYYRDLQPIEIARQLGLPASTVRSHLRRGIGKLRAQLDDRFDDDRSSWCALFVPFVRSQDAAEIVLAAPAITTTGLIVMNALTKVGVAAAAVLLTYVSLTSSDVLPSPFSKARTTEEAEVISAVTSDPKDEAQSEGTTVVDDSPGRRRVLEAESVEDASAAPVVTAGFVEAVVIDDLGNAVGGARVRRLRDDREGETATSSIDGFVRIAIEVEEEPSSFQLAVVADGFMTAVEPVALTRGETVNLGRLALVPGGMVRGNVVDETGRAIDGARITVAKLVSSEIGAEAERSQRAQSGGYDQPVHGPCAFSDLDGSFELRGVALKEVRLWAEVAGSIPEFSKLIQVQAEPKADGITIALETIRRENSVSGIVVDPNGNPVPHARLDYHLVSSTHHFASRTSKKAASDGTFQFVVQPGSVISFTASDPNDVFGPTSLKDRTPGESDLELRLTSGRDVRLVALDEQGRTLSDFRFRVLALDENERAFQSGSSAFGIASFRLPSEEFRLELSADLHRDLRTEVLLPERLADRLEYRLESIQGIVGRVTSKGGDVSGAQVRLHRLVSEDDRWERNGFRCWLVPRAISEATTNEAGGFVLTARVRDRYVVRVEKNGFAVSEYGPFDAGPDLSPGELELELGTGGALKGRVSLSTGEDPVGKLIVLHRGDGQVLTTRVDEHGMYLFRLLTPGSYKVEVASREPENRETVSPAHNKYEEEVASNCVVVDGATTRHDLHVADPNSFVFRGRIRVEGVENSTMAAFLCPKGANVFDNRGDWEQVTPGADGAFELGVTDAGDYVLVINHAFGGDVWMIMEELRVDADHQAWELELETGALEVTSLDLTQFTGDMPPWVFGWQGRDDVLFIGLPIPNGATVIFDVVPAGMGKLIRPDLRAVFNSEDWVVLRELEIRKGETTSMESPR